MKASEVQPGMTIRHPRGGMAVKVDAIVEVPEMHCRTFWYEDLGRGEYFAADVDDDIELARDYQPRVRLIGLRFIRPGSPGPLYEIVYSSQTGWSPDPFLVAEVRGPFIIERRDPLDGPWVKVASAPAGCATLTWDDLSYAPVMGDIETQLGIT